MVMKDSVRKLILGLILFPFIVQSVAMAGCFCGLVIGHWNLIVALAISFIAFYFLGFTKKSFVAFLAILGASLFAAMLPVMYSTADGDAYHRAGVILLANGWNPLRVSELSQIAERWTGFREWHLAFLPRGVWIYGATLYKWFGFVEIADSYNFLAFIAAFVSARDYVCRRLDCDRKICYVIAFLLVSAPCSLPSLYGGTNDPVLYSYLLISLLTLMDYIEDGDSRPLAILLFTCPLMGGVKYTACVLCAVMFAVFGIVRLVTVNWDFRKITGLVGVGILAAILMLMVNASPYITSTIHHGGPFYPAHTFSQNERIDDPLTYDFDLMNDDAKEMGYVGRFARAYVSEDLTFAYYRWKLNKESFNPHIELFTDVNGYGVTYRIFFLLSIVGIFFVKSRPVQCAFLFIALTMLFQPTKYMGYARYVSQIYLIPIIVGIGLMARIRHRRAWLSVTAALCGYAAILVGPLMVSYPYAWATSVQNLQMLSAAQQDSRPIIETNKLNGRAQWLLDSGLSPEVVSSTNGLDLVGYKGFGPMSRKYTYWSCVPIEDAYEFEFANVGFDTKTNRRRAGAGQFFLREFLPNEIKMFPRRISQLVKLRFSQFCRAVTNSGAKSIEGAW